MVECKFISKKCVIVHTSVLIDTWWNVNQRKGTKEKLKMQVLIDTWWNVNQAYTRHSKILLKVLIDTWWNVNMYNGLEMTAPQWRFNRYMVERKVGSD